MTALLGLATAVSWAFSNLYTHRLSRLALPRAVVMAGIIAVAVACLAPAALVADRLEGPWTAAGLGWPVAAGVFGVAALFLLVRALGVGSLSVVAPIIALEGGIAVILAVIIGERPSPLQLVLMTVAVVGAALVSMEPGRRTAAGALPAALSAFFFAAAWVSIGMSELPALTTVAVTRGTSLLLLLPLVLLAGRAVIPPRSSIRPLLACGILDAVGYVTFAFATALGSVAIASVAAAQWTTVAAIIGITILRERLRAVQYVGIVLTIAAVTALVLAA